MNESTDPTPWVIDWTRDPELSMIDGAIVHGPTYTPDEPVQAWCPNCQATVMYLSDACPKCGVLG